MTQPELKTVLDRLEFHAKEASAAARKATMEAFSGPRDAVGESEIQRNVAQAHRAAMDAHLLFLQCLRLLDHLNPEEEA
jgi:hypothetical protein